MKSIVVRCLVGIICLGAVFVSGQEQNPTPKQAPGKTRTEQKFKLPDTVKVEKDLVYAKCGTLELKLDLYLPKAKPSSPLPCIVVIHGGGWKSGDKQLFARQAAYLASQGFAAASINYRLMPEFKVLDCIQDCKAAVRWVRANAAKYGINPEQIGAIGGSAGGHLVAMLGTSYKAEKLEGLGGNLGVSSRVQAVVAMATPTDLSDIAERLQLDKQTTSLVSPVTYVDKDSAPILLLHGEADQLVPLKQPELLLAKYKDAGVPAQLVMIKGTHAFWTKDPGFTEAMERASAFFREKLK